MNQATIRKAAAPRQGQIAAFLACEECGGEMLVVDNYLVCAKGHGRLQRMPCWLTEDEVKAITKPRLVVQMRYDTEAFRELMAKLLKRFNRTHSADSCV